jgi:hypothetical protein
MLTTKNGRSGHRSRFVRLLYHAWAGAVARVSDIDRRFATRRPSREASCGSAATLAHSKSRQVLRGRRATPNNQA